VYYPSIVKKLAMNNDQPFHLAAWVKIGNQYIVGVNSTRCSCKFHRIHPDGTSGFHLHAEMDLLRKLNYPSDVKEINVVRFHKDGRPTMAMPCKYCRKFLLDHGVVRVNYSDWDGNMRKVYLNQI
jgi:cytidine deaminase